MKYALILIMFYSITIQADEAVKVRPSEVAAIDLGAPEITTYSGIWQIEGSDLYATINESRGALVITLLHSSGFDSMLGAVVENIAIVNSVLGGADYSAVIEFTGFSDGSVTITDCVPITTGCELTGSVSISRVF